MHAMRQEPFRRPRVRCLLFRSGKVCSGNFEAFSALPCSAPPLPGQTFRVPSPRPPQSGWPRMDPVHHAIMAARHEATPASPHLSDQAPGGVHAEVKMCQPHSGAECSFPFRLGTGRRLIISALFGCRICMCPSSFQSLKFTFKSPVSALKLGKSVGQTSGPIFTTCECPNRIRCLNHLHELFVLLSCLFHLRGKLSLCIVQRLESLLNFCVKHDCLGIIRFNRGQPISNLLHNCALHFLKL